MPSSLLPTTVMLFAINADGSPNTAHTTNLVPCFLLNTDYTHETMENWRRAPTTNLGGVDIPHEMTGNSLHN